MLKKQATEKKRTDCRGLDTGTVQRKGCLAFVPEVTERTGQGRSEGDAGIVHLKRPETLLVCLFAFACSLSVRLEALAI